MCSCVICTTCAQAWTDTDVSGNALAPRILSADGEIVSGRLVHGEPKQGQSAPVLMDDPIPSEIDEIQGIFTKYGARLPSKKIIFDVVQYNADNTASAPPEKC